MIEAAPGTPESDRLELLAVLAADYERRAVPPEADPADVIALAMRAKGRSQRDLSKVLGSRARASEILARRRSLSEAMIESVAAAWNIPHSLLTGRRHNDRGNSRMGRAASSAGLLVLAAGATLLGAFAWHGRDLPDTDQLLAEAKTASGVELPPHVVQAFIAAEDRRFLKHDGYDPLASSLRFAARYAKSCWHGSWSDRLVRTRS